MLLDDLDFRGSVDRLRTRSPGRGNVLHGQEKVVCEDFREYIARRVESRGDQYREGSCIYSPKTEPKSTLQSNQRIETRTVSSSLEL